MGGEIEVWRNRSVIRGYSVQRCALARIICQAAFDAVRIQESVLNLNYTTSIMHLSYKLRRASDGAKITVSLNYNYPISGTTIPAFVWDCSPDVI